MNRLITLCLFAFAVSACAPTIQVMRYDPKTGRVSSTTAAPYFETRTLLVPEKVGLHLIVDLEKKVVPGLDQIKQSSGALGPGDLDATGLFTAYVHNLTNAPISLNITAMSHQGQPIPETPVVISLRPDTYEKVVLGRVGISKYASDLKIEISYIGDAGAVTRTLTARRLTQKEIDADVAAWTGKKRNVPAFFLEKSNTAVISRELSFHDAPYWVTITIPPESRDTFEGHGVTSGSGLFSGGHAIAGMGFTPPGGGPPNQSVSLLVYDRGRGDDESETLPINPTLQEFVVEYKAHMAHFYKSHEQLQIGQMANVSTVRLGDRTWFRFKLIRTSTHSVQYWTPLDDKKMLVLDWSPPGKTFFIRNSEAKKRPEIESMIASIRVSKEPYRSPVEFENSVQ